MTASQKQLAQMKVPVNIDRHFRFERCTAYPDIRAIRDSVLAMAVEVRRLGLDTLAGCRGHKPSA